MPINYNWQQNDVSFVIVGLRISSLVGFFCGACDKKLGKSFLPFSFSTALGSWRSLLRDEWDCSQKEGERSDRDQSKQLNLLDPRIHTCVSRG